MKASAAVARAVLLLLLLLLLVDDAQCFQHTPASSTRTPRRSDPESAPTQRRKPSLVDAARFLVAATAPVAGSSTSLNIASTASSSSGSADDSNPRTHHKQSAVDVTRKEIKQVRNAGKTLADLRAEGGPLTVSTPIGALNPFALYYGMVSILLGIPWYFALKSCEILYWLTRGKVDPKRRLPVFFSHIWGTLVLRLSRSYPEVENRHILKQLYERKQPAMFVANHNSWMDIPFLGTTVGWRNYKIVSKKELGVIPILGAAIRVGGNIMIDRKDRRSQIKTLKDGIAYLKDGIHLCTFPEGTRSRTGRLLPFKNGAFKMAYKAGAPVVPISIVNSGKVMPHGWMFAMKPSYKNAKVIVHEPVETAGRTEQEVADEVRRRMIEGLPEDQRPLNAS